LRGTFNIFSACRRRGEMVSRLSPAARFEIR
jgi:hypothetical protein